MSSALLRQALNFVDPEEPGKKRGRRNKSKVSSPGQGVIGLKRKNKKTNKQINKPREELVEENIKKLLALSQPTADAAIAGKIIERAIKGKPLLEKIEVKAEEEKSILFPEEESFTKFENQYFCS